MSTFLCTRCGAVENTATSHFWWNKREGKPVLCSYCETGKWHGKFKRKHWSSYGLGEILKLQKMDKGDFINAREHLRNTGVIGSKKDIYKEVTWEENVPGDIETQTGNNNLNKLILDIVKIENY